MFRFRFLLFHIILLMLFNIQFSSSLPEPYSLVNVLPLDMHGWFHPVNKKYLEQFIKKHDPRIIVELGVWLGKSCIFMAEISNRNAYVYAIDNWNSTGSVGVQNSPIASSKLPVLYEQFLSNVIHHGLTDKIIPMKMDTLEAVKHFEIIADLIYVDASHAEEDVYNDVMAWYPKLKEGGIMCGDDYLAASVKRAMKRASEHLHVSLKSEANFWYFIK